LNIGGRTRFGKAAEKKVAWRFSAAITSCWSFLAGAASIGSCSLFLTWADCAPDVARPSVQEAEPRTARAERSSSGLRTS
jgi:hypothetical protein